MPDASNSIEQSLAQRDRLSNEVKNDPYNVFLYVERARAYESIGYPDLAVMDAYKALLLIDEVQDDASEYHEPALDSIQRHLRSESSSANNYMASGLRYDLANDNGSPREQEDFPSQEECAQYFEKTWRKDIVLLISKNLIDIGCLRSAFEYLSQTLRQDPGNPEAKSAMARLQSQFHSDTSSSGQDAADFTPSALIDRGYVRREVYPWNYHEKDRHTAEALVLLNHEMQKVAPQLEVKVTELPLLASEQGTELNSSTLGMNKQLGVFAKEDIAAGEDILKERSLLTGNSRLHEPLCDACSSVLPSLNDVLDHSQSNGDASKSLVPCPNCDDVVFCSDQCHELAQSQYHPAVCGMGVDAIAKDVAPSKAADSLYTLLLFRALAMAQTQDKHPLDLAEVKYIWGDFTLQGHAEGQEQLNHFPNIPRTLPFSFEDNILTPLHMLELMEVNIFDAPHDLSEVWVWNTLYAKFRGTASARISPRDGRPEVAAVHPLWCLANHSCDPNVRWEWAGEIKFTARESRVAWSKSGDGGVASQTRPATVGGIKKGEEILNHYVDIVLPVQERREWGVGALGGFCMCSRCLWESSDA